MESRMQRIRMLEPINDAVPAGSEGYLEVEPCEIGRLELIVLDSGERWAIRGRSYEIVGRKLEAYIKKRFGPVNSLHDNGIRRVFTGG
jgi:hypothetical protein